MTQRVAVRSTVHSTRPGLQRRPPSVKQSLQTTLLPKGFGVFLSGRYSLAVEANDYADSPFGRPAEVGRPHGYVAYLPKALPRSLAISAANTSRLGDAEAALGRLAGVGRLLPDPDLLVIPYLRREALSSARIEGTQATLLEVLDAEVSDAVLNPDLEEVVNYIVAMRTGLTRLETLPLSNRLLREIHAILLRGVRGRERDPGEFRTSQNWIGAPTDSIQSARFVPPPPEELGHLLTDFERFLHEADELPVLVRVAMAHYQFETIHPFLDGNGRLGRLLIVFYLVRCDRLPAPLLYVSPFLESRRSEYYQALQTVRESGDFDPWLAMILEAIETQASDALRRAERLVDLQEHYRAVVRAKTRGAANQALDIVFRQPLINSRVVERDLSITRPSALAALRTLEEVGLLAQLDQAGPHGQHKWQAREILAILTDDE